MIGGAPSTKGSGLETFDLRRPSRPSGASAVIGVAACILALGSSWLTLRWKVDGAQAPRWSRRSQARCADRRAVAGDLFRAVRQQRPAQAGLPSSISPSERWAAYDFADYRAGSHGGPCRCDAPVCTPRGGASAADLRCRDPRRGALPPLPWGVWPRPAVIGEGGGTSSYWAMRAPARAARFPRSGLLRGAACGTEGAMKIRYRPPARRPGPARHRSAGRRVALVAVRPPVTAGSSIARCAGGLPRHYVSAPHSGRSTACAAKRTVVEPEDFI